MRCYSKLIKIVIGALSLERTYRMQVITFLTPYSPAPCAKKYRSEVNGSPLERVDAYKYLGISG